MSARTAWATRGRPRCRRRGAQPTSRAIPVEELDGISYLIAHSLDDDRPARELRLGFEKTRRLLEIVGLLLDDGTEMAIHAMTAWPKYFDLLP